MSELSLTSLKVLNGFLKFKRSFNPAEKKFTADPKGKLTLELELDPTNSAHANLISFLKQEQAKVVGNEEAKFDIIKKKEYTSKKGEEVKRTFLRLTTRDDVIVINKQKQLLEGDDLVLPFGTTVDATGEIQPYDFNGAKGITLKLKKVIVLEKPGAKQETTFSR